MKNNQCLVVLLENSAMCVLSETRISLLKTQYPCRNNQIDLLYNLLESSSKNETRASSIFVHGGPSTGKTSIVNAIAQDTTNSRTAYINLLETYTSRILFESILNQLMHHEVDPKTGEPCFKCDNAMDFITRLKNEEDIISGATIVLDKAEEMRNMDFNLLPMFLKLKEISEVDVSVIFISEIIYEKYYSKSLAADPIKVYFPQYNKESLLEVLMCDFDNAKQMFRDKSHEKIELDADFYRNYLNVFLSVFYRVCRDVSELRHMARTNFLKYCKPILDKECGDGDSMALWRRIAPILKSSLEVLYLRTQTESVENQNQGKTLNLELPFYAKYLLIAAYLASYNSAKDDKRLFMKHQEKKRKTKKDIKLKSKVSEQLNTQMGPKPFTLDRLLAIFYSILEDKVGFNNNLLVQVSSLVELRLLSTDSDSGLLGGQKYKCNVNFEFIQGVSRMVGLNIRKYLSDFNHM